MALNIFKRNKTPSHKPKIPFHKSADPEVLNQLITDIVFGHSDTTSNLLDFVFPITSNRINWESVHSLTILGAEDPRRDRMQESSALRPGIYVDRTGEWLLLIHPQEDSLQEYLNLLGPQLKSLRLYYTALTTLDLSALQSLEVFQAQKNPKITSFPGLDKLTQLTRLDIYECHNLTHLPELRQLTRLTRLNLYECDSLEQLSGLEGLEQLTYLNLSGCSSLKQIPGLWKLTQLAYLYLSRCNNLTKLAKLNKLTQLTYLNISGCSGLAQLTYLNLSGCSNLKQLYGLEELKQLTHLNLSGCSCLEQVPDLEKLTQLTRLDISECNILAQISRLEKLTKLTRLELSGCSSLTQIPGLENLMQLTRLDLSGCRSLEQIPGLENLTQLTHLDLSGCRSLEQIPGLENLTQLTKLELSGCSSLEQISGLENLTQLTHLDLSGCKKLTVLPDGLSRLRALRQVDLSHMELETLPDWLPDIASLFTLSNFTFRLELIFLDIPSKAIVCLADTIVADMPDMSIFTQPYELVAQWFRDRKNKNTQLLNEIKVVFLGDGEAGKSHTIARLMNDGGEPVDYTDQSTPGIVIKNRDYTLDDRKFRVHYWDFGGQEIMHSMHRIFLTNRTMYVVLLNARDDTQGDRAHYWLHNIKSFAPDAPVLLVLNKIDQNENASVNEVDLRSRYQKLTQIVRLSAKTFDRDQFNSVFTDVLLAEIQKTGYLDAQWSTSWTRVKQRLESMTDHYIMGDQYETICEECQVDDNQKNLLHWFNDLGISFCCCDEEDYALKDYVILRPDWITNALYIILFNRLEDAKNGVIPHKSIHKLLRAAYKNPEIRSTMPLAKYTSGDIQYVLGVMRKFKLSFPQGSESEFIPMLCQQNSTIDVQYYHQDTDTLEFTMDFDYLPNNLLHRLMVDRNTELDMDNVWRTGARFELKELGLSAVVVIDGSSLRFFIRHENNTHRPNTYLTMLKANVDRIVARMGLQKPKNWLIYKQGEHRVRFSYERILKLHEKGRKEEYCETLDQDIFIDDILNQSAPELLTDEKKLLNAIIHSCQKLQDEPIYHLIPKPNGSGYTNGAGMEDLRNRRVRDDLITIGYRLADQTQRGYSGTGKSIGELDMLVFGENNEPWTIIEALRVSDGTKVSWNEHLKKLTEDYNKRGLSRLYLLTYVDSTPADFDRIWTGYQKHMSTHAPKSYTELNEPGAPIHTRAARFQYTRTNSSITVYHIFVQMDLRPEAPDQ